ncbi:hypothetical protein [Flagellimonas maritima]|nr:hypothetical protein [Allomuricauda aurantiaca]
MKRCSKLILIFILLISSCSESDDVNTSPNEENLIETINNLFPFTPNQNFEALYICARRNSNLEWYFNFHVDGTFDVLFTTDTNQDFSFRGNYTYINDQLTLRMDGGPAMPFPNGLNESSTVIMPQFGLVAAFATSEMVAICIGHGFNSRQPPRVNANYDCPNINIQAATDEDNAIELVHSAVPTEFPVLGSIFRQKETFVSGSANPIIRRGYGIYRQTGNEFYATFRIAEDFVDFAQSRLPFNVGNVGVPFDDFNVINGSIGANGQELIVEQLQPDEGPCVLR